MVTAEKIREMATAMAELSLTRQVERDALKDSHRDSLKEYDAATRLLMSSQRKIHSEELRADK
jgi:hypothetical protein